ncbi:Zn-dependent hydrolase [Salibacterium aidingense]|uniref:Zn-dependent hydrolase n=1 Tax=Salibacterium aidingense TaxID=384933 RepID=UPI003BCFD4F4
MSKTLHSVKTRRVKEDIEKIATFINEQNTGWTRRPFTKEYAEARSWLREKMESIGLETYIDAASNLIGRLQGSSPDLPPLVIGSHTDTVSGGGRFDGIAGVIGGLEVVRVLQEKGISLHHPLEIVDFTAEEPSEFGISTIGSRGMVNNLTEEMLERADPDGKKLKEGIKEAGGRPERISAEARKKGDIAFYLEMHIEQGPVLEQKKATVGIVTGIAGIHRYRVKIKGSPGHAGTTPMKYRKDALQFASELTLLFDEYCKKEWEEDVVGTIGRFDVNPNASNVIPGEVVFDIDTRSLSTSVLEEMMSLYKREALDIADQKNMSLSFDTLSKSASIKIDPDVVSMMEEAAQKSVHTHRLPSGAGHDANQMAEIGTSAMVFIPSKDGRSHCPEEWTDYEDVAAGIQSMVQIILRLDKSQEEAPEKR